MTDSLAGLILAAGSGERMRPLTRLRPKSLLPLGHDTFVDHAIARLEGCAARIAVNVHHFRSDMERHLRDRVHVSIEHVDGLGTAGGIANAADWIGSDDLVVANGDTWCPGDLSPLLDEWDRERVRVVVAGGPTLEPTSRIVASFMPSAEVHRLAVAPSGLYEVCWAPLAAAGRLDVVGWDGPVIDCATALEYLTANLMLSGGESVIGRGAVVEGVATRSVVWPGARVERSEVLVDAIRTDRSMTVLVR